MSSVYCSLYFLPATADMDELSPDFSTLAGMGERCTAGFQPIVDTAGHRVIGYRSRVRPGGGRIHHDAEIVKTASILSRIREIDSHARFRTIGSAAVKPKYFVKFLSSVTEDRDFSLTRVMEALYEVGLHSGNIVFEVVALDAVLDRSHLRRTCDSYRDGGFEFSLDYAGTGAESRRMIGDLRPNFIRLDKKAIRNVELPGYAATVRKLVELGEEFGVGVIAPGVDRSQTMENLWLLGVHLMEGHLFGPQSRGSGRLIPFRLPISPEGQFFGSMINVGAMPEDGE